MFDYSFFGFKSTSLDV